jgi:hypothetical protein
MSQFINEMPLSEPRSPGASVPAEDRLAGLHDPAKEGNGRNGASSKSTPSFLSILLRALSQWHG